MIREGSVPQFLHAADDQTPWQSDGRQFLLRIAQVGRFLVSSGNSIIYALHVGVRPRDAAPFLLGTCFAILLQQRGSLVLHASAVSGKNGAVLFCGSSGAGKSTTAALLCRRGFELLNDDVCSLTADTTGRYYVRSDGRMLKLWSSSLKHLDWHAEPDMAVQEGKDKFFVAPPRHEIGKCFVSAVYILRNVPASSNPCIRALSPVEAVAELMRNSYRPELLGPMHLRERYFQASASLSRSAGVFVLERRLDFSASEELVDALEAHWQAQVRTRSAEQLR